MRHRFPFQSSASVPWSDPPTATQWELLVQETSGSEANWTPRGTGVGCTRHPLPFQRSASVCTIPEAECCSPTAVQAEAELHETPPRKLCTAPLGFGVGRMRHELPFQRSASESTFPEEAL
jgi:hypothetical protein